MKRIIFAIVLGSLFGCAEKNEYKQAVLKQMKNDRDILDYKIDPEVMTNCVVDVTAKKMPGLLPFDPERRIAYRNYMKMIQLNESGDPKSLLVELRTAFGSPKELANAHSNYAESVMECVSGLVTNEEKT